MTLKRIYRVRWNKLVTWLTPTAIRKPKWLALVKALAAPVNDVYNRFISYGGDTNYRIGITLSAVDLQRALNDRYDSTLRRIRIVELISKEGIAIFQREENKPITLFIKVGEGFSLILFTKQETMGFEADFIVQIPISLLFDMKDLSAFIDLFKMESKTYIIQLV